MLPQGYVLTKDKKKIGDPESSEEELTLEEKIEEERAALPTDGLTPITKESFAAWKEKRARMK